MLILNKKDIIQHVDINEDLIPIIEEAFKSLSKGKKVIFISDDPASPIDFTHFSENEGYEISIKSTTQGIHYFTMYKY